MLVGYNLILYISGAACVLVSLKNSQSQRESDPALLKFQILYLSVLGLVQLGDWLQGSYQYALYKSFGYTLNDIALFFVVGFSSSAVFGTVVGSMADKLFSIF
jgi:hypothetical protein